VNASTPALYETRPTLQVVAGIACVTALVSAVIKALVVTHGHLAVADAVGAAAFGIST
jgi:hypothetical protein